MASDPLKSGSLIHMTTPGVFCPRAISEADFYPPWLCSFPLEILNSTSPVGFPNRFVGTPPFWICHVSMTARPPVFGKELDRQTLDSTDPPSGQYEQLSGYGNDNDARAVGPGAQSAKSI